MQNPTEAKRIMEAALLSSQEPLSLNDIRRLFDNEIGADTLRRLLDELREDWSERAIELANLSSGWRFQTRPDFQKFVDRLNPDKAPRYSARRDGDAGDHRLPAAGVARRHRGHPRRRRGRLRSSSRWKPAAGSTSSAIATRRGARRSTPPPSPSSTTLGCARWKSCRRWKKSPGPCSLSPRPPRPPRNPRPTSPSQRRSQSPTLTPAPTPLRPTTLTARPRPPAPATPSSGETPAPAPASVSCERLQKLLAAAGFGSRREIETWISAGRISVRGQVAKLGDRARPGDEVLLDQKRISFGESKGTPRVILYHKPVGELVTRSDPDGRPTVFANLPPMSPGRWVNVGRLDFNTSGLLLFTDSGELANDLMHPRTEIEREYEVRVQGGLSEELIHQLRNGVELEDGPARFLSLRPISDRKQEGINRWYRVVLAEGRNREVRRMIEAVGARVSRLIRVRFGPVVLPGHLAAGRSEELDTSKIQVLINATKGSP